MTDDQPTLKALQDRASELDVEGRSKMDRDELVQAIASAESSAAGHIPAAPSAPASAPPAEPAADPREPTPAELVGRPDLVDVAQQRAAARNPRVIGAPTQED